MELCFGYGDRFQTHGLFKGQHKPQLIFIFFNSQYLRNRFSNLPPFQFPHGVLDILGHDLELVQLLHLPLDARFAPRRRRSGQRRARGLAVYDILQFCLLAYLLVELRVDRSDRVDRILQFLFQPVDFLGYLDRFFGTYEGSAGLTISSRILLLSICNLV